MSSTSRIASAFVRRVRLGRLLPGLALGLLIASPGSAQARGAFQIGVQELETAGLNGSLVSSGFPAFDDAALTLGGFGFGTVGDLIIGGEGHGIFPLEEDAPGGEYRSRLTGGYGFFNLGYMAVSTRNLDVYPMIGIGGGATVVDIVERSSPTFDDVLDDPGTSSRLTGSTFLLSGSIGADYRFGVDRRRRSRRDRDRDHDDDRNAGLFVGVRAGWIWAPGDTRWELDQLNDVAGGPSTVTEGLFVRLSIGGWAG